MPGNPEFPVYFEVQPPPHLTGTLECLWVMRQGGAPVATHRVLPDGCADILFTAGPGRPTLQLVGPMTRYEDFRISSTQLLVGARFHPGMWVPQIRTSGSLLTDQMPLLEDFWGQRARTLLNRLAEATTPERCISLLAESIRNGYAPTPLQRVLAWMRVRHGLVSLDEIAHQAGFSPRQFRRLCLQQTGLSPKLLARIQRFRLALSCVRANAGRHAHLAADCGYFDQSHFIAEFQHFSGRTPADFLAG